MKQKFIETKLSKLIVYEENIDRIVGYVHQLDLFEQPKYLQDILHPIPAVPESMSASDLIGKFTKERKSIAWVVDEFGGTAGIVTMEDVLEEIFGEIDDEYDEQEFLEKKLSDGTIKLATSTALSVEATEKQHVDNRSAIDKWLYSEKKKNLDQNLMATKAALNIAAGLVDQGSDAAKAVAVAQTTIDTYQSATAAYKAVAGIPIVGPGLAIAAAAAAIAAGIMNVNKIVSTKVPKMNDAASASAGGGIDITPPSMPALSLPTFNLGGGANPTSQIADTLAAASMKPVRAYVVSSDITSQQALDRRTNRAAVLATN